MANSQLIVFEDAGWRNLLPLTYWRTAGELRCGRRRLLDHIASWWGGDGGSLWVRPELAEVAARRMASPVNVQATAGTFLASARWLPEGPAEGLRCPLVGVLGDDIAYIHCDAQLAGRLDARIMLDHARRDEVLQGVPRAAALGRWVGWPWDLLERSFEMLELEWRSQDAGIAGQVHERAHLIDPGHIHVGAGAVVQPGAVLDATAGPVYVERGAVVRSLAVVEGPSYIGAGSHINPGTWIRGHALIGPQCRVGGEVSHSVLLGHVNKQHHGFVGHSAVGEWVNLGAGTTTSNLKNTYGSVRVPLCGVPVDSGRAFMGAVIGDFARTGINQSLATGAVIGLASSMASPGTVPQWVPSFRFLTGLKDEPCDAARALQVAQRMMSRRRVEMTPEEQAYFLRLPEIAARMESV